MSLKRQSIKGVIGVFKRGVRGEIGQVGAFMSFGNGIGREGIDSEFPSFPFLLIKVTYHSLLGSNLTMNTKRKRQRLDSFQPSGLNEGTTIA